MEQILGSRLRSGENILYRAHCTLRTWFFGCGYLFLPFLHHVSLPRCGLTGCQFAYEFCRGRGISNIYLEECQDRRYDMMFEFDDSTDTNTQVVVVSSQESSSIPRPKGLLTLALISVELIVSMPTTHGLL